MAKSNKHKASKQPDWEQIAKYVVPGGDLGLTVIFAVMLSMTKLLPGRYLAAVCAGLLILIAAVTVLLWNNKPSVSCCGLAFGIITAILLLIGIIAAGRGLTALSNMTNPNNEEAQFSVYVRKEDPAETLGDLKDYTFGILGTLDRENVDKSIVKLEDTLGSRLRISEYDSPTELVDALLGGKVGAVILNVAYLDMLEEMEGYEDVAERVREITSLTVEIEATPGPSAPPVDLKDLGAFTVYISGIDSRTGLHTRSRSDVNIIATINPQTRQILLVSTPRDYFVPLSISNGQRDKLTHAGIYGVQVSMDTLEMLYNIDIDYYFRINFEGFKNIVDSLGGITVHSDYEFTSRHGSFHFVKGDNFMNGAQALGFARERYAFRDGDRQRGRNQMAVIRAIVTKAQSPAVLTNYLPLMDAVEGSFETSVPYELVAALVRDQLDKGGEWNVVTYSVSGGDANEVTWTQKVHAYVMIPNESMVATATDLMERVRNGEIVEAP